MKTSREIDIDEYKSMIIYFWEEKRDITRWTDFNREYMKEYLPHILHLWDEYVEAGRRMDSAVGSM